MLKDAPAVVPCALWYKEDQIAMCKDKKSSMDITEKEKKENMTRKNKHLLP